MTTIAASPSLVRALGSAFGDGADDLGERARPLREALEDFFTSGSEFGPKESRAADIVDHQVGVAGEAAGTIEGFVAALELADMAGYTRGARGYPHIPADLVSVDQADLELFIGDPDTAIFDGVIADLRAELDALEADPPSKGRMHRAARRAWNEQLAELRNQIGQYEVLRSAGHLGWGGVTVPRWDSYPEFLTDVFAATATAEGFLPDPSDTHVGRTRIIENANRSRAFRENHPFLAAAIENDVIITEQRLATLIELDEFATMPIEDFLRARIFAEDMHASFDWTADGCSGPIPDQAQHTCFRHDFMYRNARMIRDQWGTDQGFAEQVKSAADNRFGDELFDEYEWYSIAGYEVLWLWGAEGAVSMFGSVEDPWHPPAPDDFYGGTSP